MREHIYRPCTREKWDKASKPAFLFFTLTEWVVSKDMTDEEKNKHPDHTTTGGFLKVHGYQEAFRASWDRAKDKVEQLAQLKALPNFDPAVFEKIAGFDPEKLMTPSLSGKVVKVSLDGVEYEAVIK